jgi:ATP-binding cassette subfamily C (CFTR/MRP) protein 1
MFLVLLLIVLTQDFLKIVSIPSLFYFWILFLLSRVPQVILLLNDGAKIGATSNICAIVHLVLAVLGTVLECCPLRLSERAEPPPEEECSHASNLLYGWLDHLFWKGLKSPLSKEEIPTLCGTFSVRHILQQFDQGFNKRHSLTKTVDDEYQGLIERKHENIQKRRIGVSLTKSFGSTFLIAALMKLAQDLLKFAIPQLLKALISCVDKTNFGSDSDSAPWVGYFYAVSIFGIGIFQSILLQAYWKITYSVALRVRTVLLSLIYQKTLSISLVSRKDYTVGEIVTLMSSDAQTFKQVIPSLNKVWSMPLQIVLAIYFLYQELGLSIFGGVFILILLIPFNTYMGKRSQSVNKNQMKAKGTRLRRMYELLNSARPLSLHNLVSPISGLPTHLYQAHIY